MKNPEYADILIAIDPMIEFDMKGVKKAKDAVFENYLPDIQEKIQNMQLFDYNDVHARDYCLGILNNRFQWKKEFEKLDVEYNEIKNFCLFQDSHLTSLESNLKVSDEDLLNIQAMLEKSKSNIELLIRFK